MTQELILVRGPPGSGKSTLAYKIADAHNHINDLRMEADEEPTWVHIEADMFFETGPQGQYVFEARHIPLANQWCHRYTRGCLEAGNSVIVSNTFSRVWEMQPYICMAEEFGARLTVIEVQGSHGSIHGVSDEVIDEMRSRWERYP